MVDFHGGVGEGTKDGDDGHFPDGHLTNRLQVLVPLLDIHLVLLARGRDQLQGQKRRRSKLSTRCLLPSARWNSNHDSAAWRWLESLLEAEQIEGMQTRSRVEWRRSFQNLCSLSGLVTRIFAVNLGTVLFWTMRNWNSHWTIVFSPADASCFQSSPRRWPENSLEAPSASWWSSDTLLSPGTPEPSWCSSSQPLCRPSLVFFSQVSSRLCRFSSFSCRPCLACPSLALWGWSQWRCLFPWGYWQLVCWLHTCLHIRLSGPWKEIKKKN